MFCLGARMTRCIGFVFETNPKLLAENYFSFIFGYFQSVSVPSLRQVCHRQRTHALAHTHSHTHSQVSRLYRGSEIARRCVGEPVAFARTRGKSLRKCAHVVFKSQSKSLRKVRVCACKCVCVHVLVCDEKTFRPCGVTNR